LLTQKEATVKFTITMQSELTKNIFVSEEDSSEGAQFLERSYANIPKDEYSNGDLASSFPQENYVNIPRLEEMVNGTCISPDPFDTSHATGHYYSTVTSDQYQTVPAAQEKPTSFSPWLPLSDVTDSFQSLTVSSPIQPDAKFFAELEKHLGQKEAFANLNAPKKKTVVEEIPALKPPPQKVSLKNTCISVHNSWTVDKSVNSAITLNDSQFVRTLPNAKECSGSFKQANTQAYSTLPNAASTSRDSAWMNQGQCSNMKADNWSSSAGDNGSTSWASLTGLRPAGSSMTEPPSSISSVIFLFVFSVVDTKKIKIKIYRNTALWYSG
jgi:hypothetical protein